jgi:hypothetical protein
MSAVQIRVRRIRNFFIRFEANLSKYGSYSLHIRMVSVYSQASLQTGEYMLQKNISLEANIRKTLSKFLHSRKYSLANICIPANVRYALLQISKVLGLN